MDISSRIARQTALFTLLLLIAPMVVFPNQFGSSVLRASLIYAMYELLFYGLVIWMFNHRASLIQLAQASGLCFIYRLTVGAVFGLFISIAYSMNIKVSLILGTSGYLPALLLHVAAAPFVLRPVWKQLLPLEVSRPSASKHTIKPPSEPGIQKGAESGFTAISVSREHGVIKDTPDFVRQAESKSSSQSFDTFSQIPDAGGSGFERAMRYIGGDASVQMAAVIDHEGLLLGQFSRNQIESEDWAPYALSFYEANKQLLKAGRWSNPEKLRIEMSDYRIILAFEQTLTLMVVAEWQVDDLLNIRINQGLEIIRKYVAERYGAGLSDNVEKEHVPST